MPVNPTYPGVYIQEIPSGVRTIAGVATSITAFGGRTKRGVVSEPTSCFNFGEFSRRFGGLWSDGPATYAVDDFFANGGGQALILRLFKPNDANDDGIADLTIGNLKLRAANPGAWGDQLSGRSAIRRIPLLPRRQPHNMASSRMISSIWSSTMRIPVPARRSATSP